MGYTAISHIIISAALGSEDAPPNGSVFDRDELAGGLPPVCLGACREGAGWLQRTLRNNDASRFVKNVFMNCTSASASSNVDMYPKEARKAPVGWPLMTSLWSPHTRPASLCCCRCRWESCKCSAHAPRLQKHPPRSSTPCKAARLSTSRYPTNPPSARSTLKATTGPTRRAPSEGATARAARQGPYSTHTCPWELGCWREPSS
mmetsp:Transcript_44980/g.85989  ORF Transcript_44980/g.85989 Transcript_44980/m.85989 type:complete len:204 (-) Transcript_44980:1008-1619(-)